MMKAAIITAAGLSTRFNAGLIRPCLKCIYTENGVEEALLFNLLKQCEGYDRVIVVGGYQYGELEAFLHNCPKKLTEHVRMVKNHSFERYGTGYSFYMGLLALKEEGADEITLIEGDLFVDSESFNVLAEEENNAISICREPICSNRSVVIYTDVSGGLHYLYQTDHGAFQIKEAFTSILNSAQMWKFFDAERLYYLIGQFSEEGLRGTNLEMVQAYFGGLKPEQYRTICMKTWINCNTVEDYRKMIKLPQRRSE